MKILFVTPHLSTGGGPQYLLKKIQELNDDHEIYCVEYSNVTGGVLIVQRSQIEELLQKRLITLGENKAELIIHIKNINPDIIHFEELPEYFCDNKVSDEIYVPDRRYKIIETSHDSSFDVSNKRYFPDRFIFVSEYQKQLFSSLNIPTDVVEYPIEYKTKRDRQKSLEDLGLDPNKTHFLNVGLFTSRKNQAEIIEYAKSLINESVQFHFVGNQADNFKWYWEPLMKDFPSNCKWWGERKDVDTFYNAMDVFLFTSKGTNSDKETSPLVLREAIGWGMPILMYNLPVYCGMYDGYNNIDWLSSDINHNVYIIKTKINKNDSIHTNFVEEMISVDYDPNHNKINYISRVDIPKASVVVRDIDSETILYTANHPIRIDAGVSFWIIPIPKWFMDFETDPLFGGMIVELYSDEKKIFKKDIRLRHLNIVKPKLRTKNYTTPTYNNYMEFFIYGIYDPHLKGKNFNTVVDVGANAGIWIEYINHVAKCNKIYAIEPNLQALKILNETYQPSELTIVDKALCDCDRELDFFVDPNNSTIGSMNERHSPHFVVNYRVQGISFRTFLNTYNIDHIDLFKMDIEGGEYTFFQSMQKEDLDKITTMIVEYHLHSGQSMDREVAIIENLFRGAGFTCKNHPHKSPNPMGGFIFATKIK